MKKAIYLVACIMLVCALSVCFVACDDKPAEHPNTTSQEVRGFTDKDNKYLVKYDDFDNGTLDTTLWNVYGPYSDGSPHIRRGAYWDPRQVIVENNALVIRTQVREDGYYYTGAVDSNGKFMSSYGYYEARCKLPKASGLWSAFWLMAPNMYSADVTVSGAEIDIMESPFYSNSEGDNTMYQYNVHVGDYGDNYLMYSDLKTGYGPVNLVSYTNVLEKEEPVSLYDDWHTFALEWTETYYKFYIDRILVATITDMRYVSPIEDFLFLSVEVDGAQKTLEDGTNVPDAFPKQFVLFTENINVNPASNFPCDFLVDWVAVYSQKPF